MKSKFLSYFAKLIFCFLFTVVSLNGQKFRPVSQPDIRPVNMDEFQARRELLNQTRHSSQSPSDHEIVRSDSGLQRPVQSKKKGFGYHLGFSSKIYYSNNPLSAPSGLDKVSAGIWENSLNNNFLLGSYDLRGATFSPLVGLSYTNFNHFGHTFSEKLILDHLTLTLPEFLLLEKVGLYGQALVTLLIFLQATVCQGFTVSYLLL